ncbi:phosphoribosylanthranilate isomerase [Chryseobacterium aquaticum]|uniref:N-(5'-phosphoribosyl)anthranilate isomerase n=1 Tax=Chryseobacterium aquaticum subsp. greenlandense TaxID=345663 RepID=A0A101CI84_9FLAO|nr:phosphoribosylanthranilate isomerase [Chryseobacterium aquaticum]KUJ56627.1 phosphoribosylanthranilate isomerase [Chryseobacterium aquaticum subsp. greenlandense]
MTECQKQEAKSQSQLKVCGLTQLSQIRELVALKIDFLGFIFYAKSPRFVLNYLTLDDISKINHSRKVGVFVNETIENIVEFSEKSDLNLIQLHGDENDEYILRLRKSLNEKIQIIKVIRIGNQTIEELQNTINRQPITNNYLLFDTDSKAFGGTGNTFDWQILNQLKINKPYFLSGGISLENVGETNKLIQQPFALDVNSKFETEPGIKDVEKIKRLYEKL